MAAETQKQPRNEKSTKDFESYVIYIVKREHCKTVIKSP